MNFKAQFILFLSLFARYVSGYIQDEKLDLNDVPKWIRIKNLQDPHVLTIARFAISQFDMETGSKLRFINVVTGYRQIIEGMNYRLIIRAEDCRAHTATNYEAFVYEQDAKQYKHLMYFRKALDDNSQE
uniref:Cystatin domain-containing protein n=1 Tax=Kalanchoe fedtschenkoi TaxID=63787 RepID=A0A7N0USA5_KALFE